MKHLRDGIRRGRIRCSVRIWTRPHIRIGGRYPMDDGHIVVDSITPIAIAGRCVWHARHRSRRSQIRACLEAGRRAFAADGGGV